MSYTRTQRKKIRKKRVGFIILFLILYLFLKPILNIITGGLKTTLPNRELLVESISGEAFFIRNEKIVKSSTEGLLKRTAKEGARVSAGTEVANIRSREESSSLEQEIIEIDRAISSLEKSEAEVNTLESNKENLKKLRQEKIEKIQSKIRNKDYKDMNLIKEELSLYDEEKVDNQETSDYTRDTSLENLKDRREKISQEINTQNVKYHTQNGGIISYLIDDYEDFYSPKEFEKFTYEKLNSRDFLKGTQAKQGQDDMEVSIGEPIYKILDDFQWHIAIKIDDAENIKDLDINQNVKININDDNSYLEGSIIRINENDNRAVVVVEFDTQMYKFYNKRISMVELIKSEEDVLKIPKKSIIDKDGQKGVYIKNKGGIVEFRAIFEIKQAGEYAYIKTGDQNSMVYLEKDSEAIKTISVFDELILNKAGIKEGDIVN